MTRRLLTLAALAATALLALAAPTAAHVDVDPREPVAVAAAPATGQATTTTTTLATTTTNDLPGSALEAEARDDGGGSIAPWVVGSGIAALVAIGAGGAILQRRMR